MIDFGWKVKVCELTFSLQNINFLLQKERRMLPSGVRRYKAIASILYNFRYEK